MLAARQVKEEIFLTVGDVAKRLGVTSTYVQLLAKQGKLRVAARTPGGLRLFTPPEVDAFEEQRRKNPPRPGPAKGSGGRPPKKKARKATAKRITTKP